MQRWNMHRPTVVLLMVIHTSCIISVGNVVMLRKTVHAIAVSAAILTLVACNTMRGAGEDVESAANAVDNKT